MKSYKFLKELIKCVDVEGKLSDAEYDASVKRCTELWNNLDVNNANWVIMRLSCTGYSFARSQLNIIRGVKHTWI